MSRMFRFFGGAPKLLVPDNLTSGVSRASFYDPEINRTYGAVAMVLRDGRGVVRPCPALWAREPPAQVPPQ